MHKLVYGVYKIRSSEMNDRMVIKRLITKYVDQQAAYVKDQSKTVEQKSYSINHLAQMIKLIESEKYDEFLSSISGWMNSMLLFKGVTVEDIVIPIKMLLYELRHMYTAYYSK
jgi:ribulose 1,5-bisphosphate carboxylase large subunit-like protein